MLLMTPGPIEVDERVVAAAHQPAIYHQAPQFYQTVDDTIAMLRTIYGTRSDVIILPGSGRLGLEAAICSVVEPGDATLHLQNGTFAAMSVDIARAAGADATVLEGRWGGPLDLDAVRAQLRRRHYKMLLLTQSETSTGACYPVAAVAKLCAEVDTLCFVDGISSIGSIEFEMDRMGADLAVSGSHKSIGALMGLSMVGVSERAYAAMQARRVACHSYSLNLLRWRQVFFGQPAPRRFPVIPSPHMVLALHEACRLALAEGMPARWRRHSRFAEATRRAVSALGLELFPDKEVAADSITAVRVPAGLRESDILARMADKYQVMIGGSLWGATHGKLFRISHQSVQASRECLVPTLTALENTLADLGFPVERGRALAAFEQSLVG